MARRSQQQHWSPRTALGVLRPQGASRRSGLTLCFVDTHFATDLFGAWSQGCAERCSCAWWSVVIWSELQSSPSYNQPIVSPSSVSSTKIQFHDTSRSFATHTSTVTSSLFAVALPSHLALLCTPAFAFDDKSNARSLPTFRTHRPFAVNLSTLDVSAPIVPVYRPRPRKTQTHAASQLIVGQRRSPAGPIPTSISPFRPFDPSSHATHAPTLITALLPPSLSPTRPSRSFAPTLIYTHIAQQTRHLGCPSDTSSHSIPTGTNIILLGCPTSSQSPPTSTHHLHFHRHHALSTLIIIMARGDIDGRCRSGRDGGSMADEEYLSVSVSPLRGKDELTNRLFTDRFAPPSGTAPARTSPLPQDCDAGLQT